MRPAYLSLSVFLGFACPAQADHAANYVVPGRSDVPVIINGYDAAWGIAESDWGLYRAGALPVVVIPSPHVRATHPVRHYFPSLGELPHAGRLEVEPPANRALPPPAQSFHRSWSSSSAPLPPTEYAPSPPIIVAPEIDSDGRRHHRHR